MFSFLILKDTWYPQGGALSSPEAQPLHFLSIDIYLEGDVGAATRTARLILTLTIQQATCIAQDFIRTYMAISMLCHEAVNDIVNLA